MSTFLLTNDKRFSEHLEREENNCWDFESKTLSPSSLMYDFSCSKVSIVVFSTSYCDTRFQLVTDSWVWGDTLLLWRHAAVRCRMALNRPARISRNVPERDAWMEAYVPLHVSGTVIGVTVTHVRAPTRPCASTAVGVWTVRMVVFLL